MTMIALRDLAAVKKTKGAPLCFFTSTKEASAIAAKYTLGKILYYYDALEKGIEDLGYNANVPNTLVSLIINSKKKGN